MDNADAENHWGWVRYFSWRYLDEKGWKVFELKGSLFFASIAAFQNIFNPANDPEVVVIDFKEAKVVDHSAWQRLTA